MSISIERVSQPISFKGIEDAFFRVLAADIETAFVEMKTAFGKDVSDDLKSAVLTAQAFGDSVLVQVRSAKGDISRALDPAVDLDSLLSETEKLSESRALEAKALRDTVSSVLEKSLVNIEDLVQRARSQAY
jgi:hypothetical protein